jgi:hypothetical protein
MKWLVHGRCLAILIVVGMPWSGMTLIALKWHSMLDWPKWQTAQQE